jgi:hypothetical protein
VVAVRTPAAPPRPIEQRQAQFGGRFDEQTHVRVVGPIGPVRSTNPNERPQSQDGFRPFTQPNSNNQVRQIPNSQPRTYEQQGTAQGDIRNAPPENRNAERPNQEQPNNNRGFQPPQSQMRPTPQESHPLVRPTPPVQERTPQQEQQQAQKFNQWHQERQSAPPRQQSRPAPAPRQEKPSNKKGH